MQTLEAHELGKKEEFSGHQSHSIQWQALYQVGQPMRSPP